MPDVSPLQILLEDPLREVSRKERRTLLALSAFAIFVQKTRFVPSEVNFSGVKFPHVGKTTVYSALLVLIVYFLLTFAVYALTDFLSWKHRFRDSVDAVYIEKKGDPSKVPYPRKIFSSWPAFAGFLRAGFDFAGTPLAGSYAVWCLARSIS
jgi:hypothetical protein